MSFSWAKLHNFSESVFAILMGCTDLDVKFNKCLM